MEKIIWSNRSKKALFIIWKFYSEKNVSAADKMIKGIIETVENISFPEQYQKEEMLEKKYCRAVYRHYKIIYSVDEDILKVLQVFDTRQDPQKINS